LLHIERRNDTTLYIHVKKIYTFSLERVSGK